MLHFGSCGLFDWSRLLLLLPLLPLLLPPAFQNTPSHTHTHLPTTPHHVLKPEKVTIKYLLYPVGVRVAGEKGAGGDYYVRALVRVHKCGTQYSAMPWLPRQHWQLWA